MTARTGRVFPGGPHRTPGDAAGQPWIPTMQERSSAAARTRVRRSLRTRRGRLAAAVLLVLALAAGAGVAAGRRVAPHQAEPDRQGMLAGAAAEQLVSRELNRVLLELWKMESLEVRP